MPFFAALWTSKNAIRIRCWGCRFCFARRRAGSALRIRHDRTWQPQSIGCSPVVDSLPHRIARVALCFSPVLLIPMFRWSAQSIYARAFYATGDTMSRPLREQQSLLFMADLRSVLVPTWTGGHGFGVASDIGICHANALQWPCCSIAGTWSRWRVWITRKWAGPARRFDQRLRSLDRGLGSKHRARAIA